MPNTKLLLISLVFFFGFESGPVHAHGSGNPALGSFLRRVTAAGADGSWLFGWAWGADQTVSVVERTPPVNFAARPASFGPLIDDAVMGYGIPMDAFTARCEDGEDDGEGGREWHTLVHDGLRMRGSASANIGCPPLCLSEGHLPMPSESWIAIVQRGECAFVEKVREAQRFGAKAVVVGGDDPAESGNPDTLVNMYSQGDASDVKIPSTFIKFSDYVLLTKLIATSNTSTSGIRTVSLQISTDYASWEWYSPILTFIVLLLLPSSLTLVTLLIHRVRAARQAQRERAPEDVVAALPWRVWTGTGWEKREGTTPLHAGPKSADDLENGDPDTELERYDTQQCLPSTSHGDVETHPWFEAQTECAICLCEFVKGDHVRVLPCKHIFHMDEVDEWLIHRKKLCPVCKADVTQPSHPYADDSAVPAESLPVDSVASGVEADAPTSPLRSRSRSSSTSTATERTPLILPRHIHDRTHTHD